MGDHMLDDLPQLRRSAPEGARISKKRSRDEQES